MTKKRSNRAKLNMSNAQHFRLQKMHYDTVYYGSDLGEAQKSYPLMNYHREVYSQQVLLKRLLSKDEKRKIFLEHTKQNSKR